MKKDTINELYQQAQAPIVIADECGDSMWDAVLGQEIKASQVKKENSPLENLLNKIAGLHEFGAIDAKQVSEATV